MSPFRAATAIPQGRSAPDFRELTCDTCGLVLAQRTIIDKDGARGERYRKGVDLDASLGMLAAVADW